jgi:hypothetical protein
LVAEVRVSIIAACLFRRITIDPPLRCTQLDAALQFARARLRRQ